MRLPVIQGTIRRRVLVNCRVDPDVVESCFSSYFADEARFPQGSVEPDCALFMHDIEHEWHQETDLHV